MKWPIVESVYLEKTHILHEKNPTTHLPLPSLQKAFRRGLEYTALHKGMLVKQVVGVEFLDIKQVI